MKLTEAQAIAIAALDKHGLLDEGWTFHFDRAKIRFGVCRFGSKRISISEALTELNDATQVTDTILHEVAHALAGVGNGHNQTWKNIAAMIGAKPERCYSTANVIQPAMKYTGTCPNGHEVYSMKRRRRLSSCAVCCKGRFNTDYLISWKEN